MSRVNGVTRADASFIRGQAVVEYEPEKTSPQALVIALNQQTPYRASVLGSGERNFREGTQVILLDVGDDPNPQRTWTIAMELARDFAVTDVQARIEDARVGVRYDPGKLQPEEIVKRVRGLGFQVRGVVPLKD